MKEELGQRIRQLREERGLSRQELCGLEDLLTIRQLQRIEKGQSLPTMATALYIADQLGVSLDALANRESLELPAEYLDLKYQLQHLYHYGDPERMQQQEELIEEIYAKYFDLLPEEEQLSIQLAQAVLDMIASRDASFDQGLLDDHLVQVRGKQQLTLNDLEIIRLRLLSLALGDFDKREFLDLLSQVLAAAAYVPQSELEKLQNLIISAAGILTHYGIYENLAAIIAVLNEMMAKRNNFQDNVFVYALKWKLALFVENDYDQAKAYYQKVSLMAEFLSEDLVKRNMQTEWIEDLGRKGLEDTDI